MHPTPIFHRPLVVLLVAAGLVLASCSSDPEDPKADTTTTTASGAEASTTTEVPAEPDPLQILVSNDDGYDAPGIDALVTALADVDGVEVVVVAPLEQQSGSGGSTTDGPLAVTDVTLASGYKAKAVDGFPADSIRVAVDELGIEPDLVITGINSGQNLGPLLDVSGTVGAARAAVARGIPALATSSGRDGFDYEAALPFILDWLAENRAALADGSAAVEVTNLNVPSCASGDVRGLAEVPPGGAAQGDDVYLEQDCASTTPLSELTNDVDALNAGYATLDVVPSEPAPAA